MVDTDAMKKRIFGWLVRQKSDHGCDLADTAWILLVICGAAALLFSPVTFFYAGWSEGLKLLAAGVLFLCPAPAVRALASRVNERVQELERRSYIVGDRPCASSRDTSP
jgi:hypothetical protein